MSDIIKILLVDDDEDDFILTKDILNEISHRKYQLDWAAGYDQALSSVNKEAYDVYLIDYRLGAKTGLDFITAAIQLGCKVPLILLTGQGDINIDEQAMQMGASDYLVKGNISPFHLERAIRYSIQNSKNIIHIQELNTDLERRVEERTIELEKAILQLKKAEADILKTLEKERELNELKSRFVTMASHEFKTPLSTILSSASLIAKYPHTEDSDKREKHINRIKSAVNNLSTILNDFLSLSRLEEGSETLRLEEIELNPLVKEVTEEMEAILKANQNIEYTHNGSNTPIQTDRHLLKNIFINIISNAIKYSPSGKTIYFKTKTTDQILEITIQDQGIGIPTEDKPYLFTRFFRSSNAGNIQGTGLGLNIVKRYIELLNGKISFMSELNQGTTFIIKLPIRQN